MEPCRIVWCSKQETAKVVGSGRTPDGIANLSLQFRCDDFIGVEKENPIGGGRFNAEATLCGKVPVQGVLKNTCTARSGHVRRSVRTEVVDDEYFVGKANGRKRTGE